MNKPAFAAVTSVVLLGVAGLGFLAGRQATLAPLREQLARNPMNTFSTGHSLADAFAKEDHAALSSCFLDGAQAASRFGDYAWAPAAVPTPFVGFGPRPGRHLNAFVTPLQLRAERDPAVPKPAGRTRVLLVGGSVAFGSGAPSQDRTVGGYLEKLLREKHVEVFTLAYPWWTSTHERIAIEQRVEALEPDLVLVLSGANDVVAGLRGADVRWMRTPVDEFWFERVNEDYRLAGFAPLADVVPKAATAPPPDVVAERLKANVLLEAKALPGRVRFLLQPCLLGSKKALTAREKAIVARNEPATIDYFARSMDEVRGALGPTGVFSDVSDAFDQTADDVFLDIVHFADRGNELVARRILDRIGF